MSKYTLAVATTMIIILVSPLVIDQMIKKVEVCEVSSGDVVTDRIKGSKHVVEEVSTKVFPSPCSVKIDGRWRFGSEFASE